MKPARRLLRAGVGTAVLAVLFLLMTGPARAAIAVTDDRGQSVTLAAPAQRIVSLLPSLTESVCALGACARLVGVDRYSSEPPAVRALPRLGGGLDPSLEAIVALKPDVVLAAGSTRGLDRLQALGLRVVALEPRTHADQRRVFAVLAPLLGLPPAAATQAWQRIDESVTATAAALSILASIQVLGASKSAVLEISYPLFVAVFSVLFFGGQLQLPVVVGGVFIFIGSAIIVLAK